MLESRACVWPTCRKPGTYLPVLEVRPMGKGEGLAHIAVDRPHCASHRDEVRRIDEVLTDAAWICICRAMLAGNFAYPDRRRTTLVWLRPEEMPSGAWDVKLEPESRLADGSHGGVFTMPPEVRS